MKKGFPSVISKTARTSASEALRPVVPSMKQGDVALHQAAQRDAPEVGLLGELTQHQREGMLAAQLHVAIGAEKRHAGIAHLADQKLHESQGGLVGPVQVVEKQDQRPGAARAVEEARDAVEEAEAGLLRLHGIGLGEIGKAASELGNQGRDVGCASPELLLQPRSGQLRHQRA